MTRKPFVLFLLVTLVFGKITYAQELKLKSRKADAMGGAAFALSISDSTLTLKQREDIIFNEIKNGNIPDFF